MSQGCFSSRSVLLTARMLLSLCLLLLALSPSSQKICSAPGDLPAPTLYLSQTSARQGDSVQFQCSVIFQIPAARVFFCKDGKKILFQVGSVEKANYNYDRKVSEGSSGNYSCGYEIKDSDNQVNRSQISPAKHLSITGPLMSPAAWAVRCILLLLLLVSAPVITFVLEKWGLPEPEGLEETREGSSSAVGGRIAESGRTLLSICDQWRQRICSGRYQCPALHRWWRDTIGQCYTISPCNNCHYPGNWCANFQPLLSSCLGRCQSLCSAAWNALLALTQARATQEVPQPDNPA